MLATARAQECVAAPAGASKRHIPFGPALRRTGPLPLPKPETLTGADAIELGIVTSIAGLESLESEWAELFQSAGRDINVFQSFNWIWHWTRHFLAGAKGKTADRSADCGLYILTGRRGGRLVLVLPMIRKKHLGLTVIALAGDPVSQYGDILVDPAAGDELVAQAWQMLKERSGADVIVLRKVRADSNLGRFLHSNDVIVTDRQVAPFLDLSSAPDFATYEARYSAKARKNRRRLLRRLEESGPVRIAAHTAGARAGELARLAVALKRAWVKHRGLVSRSLSHPATLNFFVDVTSSTERPVGALVTVLEAGGEAAAIEMAFDCKGRRAVHLIVYALRHERSGAGQLLIERCARQALEAGMSTYDFLSPGDSYKLEWADGHVEVLDLAQALSPRGRVFAKFYLAHGRRALKTAANTLTRVFRRRSSSQ